MVELTTYNIKQFMVQADLFLLKLELLHWQIQYQYFSESSGPSVSDVMPRHRDVRHSRY